MALTLPPNFLDLHAVYDGALQTQINTIGVVVDFLPSTKSGGTDWTIKFTLHDHSWTQGVGLPVRFFQKLEDQLPKIQNQGDVVILRNVKLVDYRGQRTVLSISASSWVVIEHASLQDSSDSNGPDVVFHQSGTGNYRAAPPSQSELQYAKALLQLQDPSRWQAPAKPTALQVHQIQRENGGIPRPTQDKFRTIADLELPQHKNDKAYVDLFAEVRRLYAPDHDPPRLELSITDYTENPFLYNYKPDKEDPDVPFEGDRFRYIENTHKMWPGPWGKMTMLVILWQPHREYALSNVGPGSFVFLKNVQIQLDREGSKLEGHCRTDRLYESRVNVSIFKVREAEGDERFKALLQRKRDYEQYCDKQQLRFIRDAQMKKSDLKRKKTAGADTTPGGNSNLTKNAKRNRENKKRRRAKANAESVTANEANNDANTKVTANDTESNFVSTNAHVRCNNTPIKLTTINSILDPSTLLRTTPSGNEFFLPFQNCCYKSKVRVVDFFPDNLEDFTTPVRESQYAALATGYSDSENEGDSESDITMSDGEDIGPSSTGRTSGGDGEVKWQWRFFLLVEDARPVPQQKDREEEEPARMELLVADSDADYLLRDIEACNLRKNPKTLARLREKLFVLWGDLQERKEEVSKKGNSDMEVDGIGGRVKASARPFECFIKEYGVRGVEKKDEWERMFRLCYTCI